VSPHLSEQPINNKKLRHMINFPYKNPTLPVPERVCDLLSRMTIEEKIAQLTGGGTGDIYNTEFLNDPRKMDKALSNGINSIHQSYADIKAIVENRNIIQRYLVEKTRLGIPALFIDEGLHGMMCKEATVFPQAIGLACSWDTDLFEKIFAIVAHEMRSRGTHVAFSPVIDVCRDPRWGRVEETYGEDPYLNGMLGSAAVRGLQGSSDGKIGPRNVAATLKHFAGHGQPEGGQNQAPANYSDRVLYETHFQPFKICIDRSKPLCIMPSYNEIDGVPSHANEKLLKDVLRNEFGFDGIIVCDFFAVHHLYNRHFVASNDLEAAELAFNSGVQCEFPYSEGFKYLPDLLNDGRIKLSDIDMAVSQFLKLKFELGLFENPYVNTDSAIKTSIRNEHREAALTAARESIVLLKNDNILPLPKDKYGKIAVIGPCAQDTFLGGYSGEPYYSVSLLDGIRSKAGTFSEILFAQGCRLTANLSDSHANWKSDTVIFPSREENMLFIDEAVRVAQKADIVILAIGENEHLCREAWSQNHIGDNSTLDLFGQQDDLARAIAATGKPVVVYLVNGRPLSINFLVQNSSAIIEGWYMGQETGTAAADIIFGDINPSGKLTITFPKSAGQLPMYYNHKPSAQFLNYLSEDTQPIFPFGHGLSYTTFEYSEISLSSNTMKSDETITVSIDISNTGIMDGDEIVQLYIRDKFSSVTRPVKELKDFARISFEADETKTVSFTIDKSRLVFLDKNMNYTVEPGEFDIMIGRSSADVKTATICVE